MDIQTIENKYGFTNIPGLFIRRLNNESDFGIMAAIIQVSKGVDQLERVDTGEDLARYFSHQKNFDPCKDIFFVEVDGVAVGFGRVRWRAEQDGKCIYNHYGLLAPQWRRKGIGRQLLYYNQRRLKEISTQHTQEVQCCFEASAANTEVGANALLKSENYYPVRYFSKMVRPDLENIQQADIPPGLKVRPVKPEHYQKIRAASREAFRDHWGFSEDTEPTIEELIEDPNFDPTLWQVAWDADEVAGMILNFIDKRENDEYNRKRGWTENISVRRPWRRRGARGLLSKSLLMLKEIGMEEAALGVDTENLTGALRLYKSMGFKPVKRYSTYQKEFEIGVEIVSKGGYMVIRAIIWDLGGVLVRTEEPNPRESLAARYGMTCSQIEELVFGGKLGDKAQRGEISIDQHWGFIGHKLGLTQGEINDFISGFWGGDILDTALIDYIRSLRPEFKTGLLSNAFGDLRRMLTDEWEIFDLFDEVIISAEVGLVKPDPRIYQLAVGNLGVEPNETVFIDDFAHNVEVARAVNLKAIRSKNTRQTLNDLALILSGE